MEWKCRNHPWTSAVSSSAGWRQEVWRPAVWRTLPSGVPSDLPQLLSVLYKIQTCDLWESWTPIIWCNRCWVDVKGITLDQREPLYCVLFFSVNLWQRFSSRGGASCVTHIVDLLFQSCHRSIGSTHLTMSDSGQTDGWSAYLCWYQRIGDRNIHFDVFTDNS